MSPQLDQMAMLLQTLTGKDMGVGAPQAQQGGKTSAGATGDQRLCVGRRRRPYQRRHGGANAHDELRERLAKRSVPDMDGK